MVGVYDKTITIVNKLKKADIVNGTTDAWYKKVLTECEHKRVPIRNVSGATVSIGQSVLVLIPFGKGYLPYNQWKTDVTKGYTVSVGDIVFLDMSLSEVPTSANITSLKNQYNGVECKVVQVVDSNGIATVEVKIEGV